MEDSKNSRENSPSSPPSSLDSSKYEIRARINPLHINNVTNGDDQDASTNKHNDFRARGILVRSSKSPNSPNRIKEMNPSRSLIDMAVPFESVKAAVNMFGGTVDWKTQRLLTKEHASMGGIGMPDARHLRLHRRREKKSKTGWPNRFTSMAQLEHHIQDLHDVDIEAGALAEVEDE